MRTSHADRRRWLQLADGRRLAYTETGPRHGRPVIYSHGAIGSPIGRSVDLEQMTDELGVRYIAPNRPGVGGSAPAPERTVLDFAADIASLADALELERFDVVGVSAGGPYALAIAHQLPGRVDRLAICSSLSPLCVPHRTPGMERRIRAALALLARFPDGCTALGDTVVPVIRRHPRLLSRVISAHAAPTERARLARADERAAASASFLDAAEHGVGGMIEDYLTYCRPWGFDVAEVGTEVQLWHGLADPLVPPEHALQLAVSLPNCRVFLDPDEGHHFFRSRLGKILAVLTGVDGDEGEEIASALARVQAAARRSARGGR
jgi:pimeloyl-ACP methyl ester carboxylesterase